MLSFRTVPHCLVPIPRNSPVHAQTTQLMISRTQQQQKAAKACPSRQNGDWTPWTPCIFWQSSFRWNISSVALKETERVSVTNFDRVLESLSLDDVGPHDFWRLQVKLLRTVSNFNMDRKSWCPMHPPSMATGSRPPESKAVALDTHRSVFSNAPQRNSATKHRDSIALPLKL